MKKIIILLFICILCSCNNSKQQNSIQKSTSEYLYNQSEKENIVRIVELGSELGKGSLSLKKIYIIDHQGITHEILCASTRMCSGGEYMLELCKYQE